MSKTPAPLPQSRTRRAMAGYIRQFGYRIVVGLLITALFALHAARISEIPLLRQLENIAYDVRLGLTLPGGIDPRIVIVDIDEKSLAEQGRWPWSRSSMATLLDNLFDHYAARVVGFDVVFAEPEGNARIDALLESARSAGRGDVIAFVQQDDQHPDLSMARSLSGRNVVLGYYFARGPRTDANVGLLPEPLLPAEIAEMLDIPALPASGYGANLEVLQSSARAGGFFDNPLNDDDGVFRRIPMVQAFEGSLYTSLALAVSELALGEPVQFSDANDRILIAGRAVPVDENMAALVPFRGAQGSFPYVSATDVLQMNAPQETLHDAIVLVGTTAPGLFDLRNTPVQRIYPGVEIHANVISGILDDRFMSQPDYTVALELVQILVIGLLLSFVLPLLTPNNGTILTLIFLLGTIGINAYLWLFHASVLPISAALLLITLHYVYVTSYGFIMESRNKRALMVQFGRYVPGEIVDEMSRNPDDYTLEGQRLELTVMFTDIRNFTRLSEKLEPQVVARLMNIYLSRMTEVIHDRLGTIDKYIGDAIMAFWGAPVPDDKHAVHAVATAIAMRESMTEINETFVREGWPMISIGIGINTGMMAVGNMGSSFRMAYTVMGDAVNLASRIEALNKIYRTTIIVTGSTARAAPQFRYRMLDRVRVRGREEGIDILEPLVHGDDVSPELEQELEEFDAAMAHYRNMDWNTALALLDKLDLRWGKRPLHDVYRERIIRFRDQPPAADWGGVFDLDG